MKLKQHNQLQLHTSKEVRELKKSIMVESLPSVANKAGQVAHQQGQPNSFAVVPPAWSARSTAIRRRHCLFRILSLVLHIPEGAFFSFSRIMFNNGLKRCLY